MQIVLDVSEEMLARMRANAEGNQELENLSDEELVKWVGNSLQTDFDNGDLVDDQFNY